VVFRFTIIRERFIVINREKWGESIRITREWSEPKGA